MSRGEFFRIDRRTWAKVCTLGMREAVAYLVLAKFSGRDNRTTAASTNAVEKYTGISRGVAKQTLLNLRTAKVLVQTQGGTRPRYDIVSWDEVAPRPNMTAAEQRAYAILESGEQPESNKDIGAACTLLSKGWAQRDPEGRFVLADEDNYIWLPNSLISVDQPSISSPVERLRQTGDVMTLRLLIDLYHHHGLVEDGGISRHVMYCPYDAVVLGEKGIHRVVDFQQGYPTACPVPVLLAHSTGVNGQGWGKDLWKRLGDIQTLGLLEWIPSLCEDDAKSDPDASVVHALGGDDHARGVWRAAQEAACKLLPESYERLGYALPIHKHQRKFAVVGIARLTHRPWTQQTAKWWAEHVDRCKRWDSAYEHLDAGQPLRTNVQHQGVLKDHQRGVNGGSKGVAP